MPDSFRLLVVVILRKVFIETTAVYLQATTFAQLAVVDLGILVTVQDVHLVS